jgi:rfaE bifunctional protein kinase chain/domain
MNINSDLQNIVIEIKKLIKPGSRVTFVSGNFNIVHPGHLRLLRFAAECGDFLIIGVNSKENNGAILKEEFRLEGIKSISFVDYAFILNHNPGELINILRPDIVVKGKEFENRYNLEQTIVESYGGKLIFSSGDVTFSSLDLLRSEFTELNHNTIIHPFDFLKRHKIKSNELKDTIYSWAKLKVIVIGDLIVDEYITCDALGMSQEDPTIVVTPIDSQMFIGGAGIVAAHAAGLGAKVSLISVTGNDLTANFAKQKLINYNVDVNFFEDESRMTSLKQRYRANNKTLLRVSHLRQNEIPYSIINKIKNQFISKLKEVDLVIFSDFNYGCLPQNLVEDLIQICNEYEIMMVADSQSSSQLGDISRFKNMDLITPTEREARLALRDFDSGLAVISEKLINLSNAKNVISTLGAEGVLIHTSNNDEGYLTDRIPALNVAPKDVAGAGDSFLTCCAMSLALGCNIWESSFLGSLAAACQVGRIGNVPLTLVNIETELDNCNIK